MLLARYARCAAIMNCCYARYARCAAIMNCCYARFAAIMNCCYARSAAITKGQEVRARTMHFAIGLQKGVRIYAMLLPWEGASHDEPKNRSKGD